jgi:hypothetical protein
LPEFKEEVDMTVLCAKSVVYIGWRPQDSGYEFFEWIKWARRDESLPLTLLVEAHRPNVDSFSTPYQTCFKTQGRAEELLELVPPWMRDCVVWQDGPEHLRNDVAERTIRSWQLLGFRTIVLSTPDGWLDQGPLNGNEYERHLGAWTKREYEALKFKVEKYSAGLIGFWRKG